MVLGSVAMGVTVGEGVTTGVKVVLTTGVAVRVAAGVDVSVGATFVGPVMIALTTTMTTTTTAAAVPTTATAIEIKSDKNLAVIIVSLQT